MYFDIIIDCVRECRIFLKNGLYLAVTIVTFNAPHVHDQHIVTQPRLYSSIKKIKAIQTVSFLVCSYYQQFQKRSDCGTLQGSY